jgi:hypothetical protein
MMREVEIAHGTERPDHSPGWLEVTAGFARYVNAKPAEECELRTPKKGDSFFEDYGNGPEWDCAAHDWDVFPCPEHHLRWCKPRVDVDAMREEMTATLAAVNRAQRAHLRAYQRYMDALKGGAA